MKKISVITPTYNEEENIEEICRRVRAVFDGSAYEYEHICIDNASTDRTVPLLRTLVAKDRNIKVIVNARNFGQSRSPIHALLQANGDAAIFIPADLQEPPELIPRFLEKWEEGYKLVVGVKSKSDENAAVFFLRRLYYAVIAKLSEVEQIRDFNGFGLYDRAIIEIVRKIDDPYPYFRGLLAEIGFEPARLPYTQATRKRGYSKSGFYSLYDTALLGITTHSKIPLRITLMLGFCMSLLSLLLAVVYLAAKLLYWDRFSMGLAPIMIGLFFFFSLLLFFMGVLGEYLLAIHTQVFKRPLVVERERINF